MHSWPLMMDLIHSIDTQFWYKRIRSWTVQRLFQRMQPVFRISGSKSPLIWRNIGVPQVCARSCNFSYITTIANSQQIRPTATAVRRRCSALRYISKEPDRCYKPSNRMPISTLYVWFYYNCLVVCAKQEQIYCGAVRVEANLSRTYTIVAWYLLQMYNKNDWP